MSVRRLRRVSIAILATFLAGEVLALVRPGPAWAFRPTASDSDPENKIWNCDTNRVPFGDPQDDHSRCITFRYSVPAGGITSAFLNFELKPNGGLSDNDALVIAVGKSFDYCAFLNGGMTGCVILHQNGFSGEAQHLNVDLFDIGCDKTVTVDADKQKAVTDQLQKGVVHLLLQDDTVVFKAELVVNEGGLASKCGPSAVAGTPASTAPPTLPATTPPTAPRTLLPATLPPTTPAALPPTTPATTPPPPTVPISTVAIPNDADASCLYGDIDNLGFGFPPGFDVFSGRSTPPHPYPWTATGTDASGTDRIMVGTGAKSAADGYAGGTRRPDNAVHALTLTCDPPSGLTVTEVALQLFIDDFQAPALGSKFTATVNGVRFRGLEAVLNAVNQTGPIGKLITVTVPQDIIATLPTNAARLVIDDATTGVGDGFAIDFARILLNPHSGVERGSLQGRVLDATTQSPIAGAVVTVDATGATAGVDGAYTLTNVPAGLAVATASAPGFHSATRSADVIAGETATFDFLLGPVAPTPTRAVRPTTTRAATTTRPATTTVAATTRPAATTTTATTARVATTTPATTARVATTTVASADTTTGPTTTTTPVTTPAATSTTRPKMTTTSNSAGASALAVGQGVVGANQPTARADGDCDGSGRIDEADALCAIQMAVEIIKGQPAVDLDGDGRVTSHDAALILRRATRRP